jgi:ferredoxin
MRVLRSIMGGKKTLVFPQLCHGCGSCTLVCPEAAIHEIPDKMGVLERGPSKTGVWFAHGVLDIGEPMAVPFKPLVCASFALPSNFQCATNPLASVGCVKMATMSRSLFLVEGGCDAS